MLDRIEAAAARRRPVRRGVNPDARPEPTMSMGSDCLPQIKHIVVLMMENHSYDNYFGMLTGRGEGFTMGPDGAPSATNPRRGGGPVRAYHLDSTGQVPHVPVQSWHAAHLQWNGGRND